MAKNALKNAQGEFRVMKSVLESRINERAAGGHQAAPWMVMHAAIVIKQGRKDDEGFTPRRRWNGQEFTKPVSEFRSA